MDRQLVFCVAGQGVVDGVRDFCVNLVSWLNDLKDGCACIAEPEHIPPRSLVVVSYPMKAWGHDPAPFRVALSACASYALILHEWEKLNPIRKVHASSLASRAARIIFCQEEQAALFIADHAALTDRVRLINIGPNFRADLKHKIDMGSIGHFGVMYKAKQPQVLLRLLRAMRRVDHSVRMVHVGGHVRGAAGLQFAARLRGVSDAFYDAGPLSADDVPGFLGSCRGFIQLFDDGASERRGSLLAALTSRAAIVTTCPVQSSDSFLGTLEERGGVHFLPVKPTEEEICRAAEWILSADLIDESLCVGIYDTLWSSSASGFLAALSVDKAG